MRTKRYDITNIGKKIRQRRIERNITIEELAKKVGVAKSTISRIESGEKNPSLVVFASICEALIINMNKLCSVEATDVNNEEKKDEIDFEE